jgi:TRAP-type C4-dicarboxylate transport system permease small subunit
VRKILAAVDKLNSGLGFLSGCCIACGAILIITEIFSRSILQKSLLVADEYTGYLMAASSFLGLGFVEMKHGHIRMDLIDLLSSRFPRMIAAFRIAAYVAASVFALYLAYVGWKLFQQSYAYGSKSMQISETPLAIPQFLAPLGAIALFLQYVCNLFRYCVGLRPEAKEL